MLVASLQVQHLSSRGVSNESHDGVGRVDRNGVGSGVSLGHVADLSIVGEAVVERERVHLGRGEGGPREDGSRERSSDNEGGHPSAEHAGEQLPVDGALAPLDDAQAEDGANGGVGGAEGESEE